MTALMSENVADLVSALASAKRNFRPAVKDSENPHFRSKFVSLAGVYEAVDKALLDNDLVLVQQTDSLDGQTVLVSRLLHVSGQWLAAVYPLRPIKADPQAEGSALTYARRYAAMALLGIAPEDDDGNAASRASQATDDADEGLSLSDWREAIKSASTPEILHKLGNDLASSPLPAAARVPLKEIWSARMKELQPS